ncbi:MAG: trypsin-like peptidase domain-containing protein [Planctomycetota bacterium]|jgi:serine protease Do|nr:trypsin-like peptidase domain-containing protein [Planctomycetota bacterium]MDA1200983.1 trypsin-like peptidase domain-containing protein [Planctomycetota bacterium]
MRIERALVSLACCLALAAVSVRASEARRTAIVVAVESQRDAVVNIHGQKLVGSGEGEGGELRRVNGMGTGVVLDSRGYIVTNYHVVEGVKRIEVTLASGRTVAATLISHDPRTDLAVVKLDVAQPLPVARIGTSSDLMIGETVLALGNAYGYEHTVTRGIISALHRNVEVSRTQRYDDLIQTDASINPGNSGGPLLNIDGEVIGINVAVRAGAQGIGFAIPIDRVLDVVSQLLSVERIAHTWHGLVVRGDGLQGAVVEAVHRLSPADCVGVKAGDRIKRIGDVAITHQLDVERALLGRKPGELVPLTVVRAGGEEQVELSVAAMTREPASIADRCWREVGLRLEPLPSATVQRLQSRYRGGLLVAEVRPDGPAAEQGIRKGDILVGLHVWETIAMDNLSYILQKADEEHLNPIKFYVLRGRETLFGHIVSETLWR